MTPEERRLDRKDRFIEKLATYLIKDQAHQSIRLQMGNADAQVWQDLRSATPLFGYPTVEEGVEILKEFLK